MSWIVSWGSSMKRKYREQHRNRGIKFMHSSKVECDCKDASIILFIHKTLLFSVSKKSIYILLYIALLCCVYKVSIFRAPFCKNSPVLIKLIPSQSPALGRGKNAHFGPKDDEKPNETLPLFVFWCILDSFRELIWFRHIFWHVLTYWYI